jgi:hypothetical protein
MLCQCTICQVSGNARSEVRAIGPGSYVCCGAGWVRRRAGEMGGSAVLRLSKRALSPFGHSGVRKYLHILTDLPQGGGRRDRVFQIRIYSSPNFDPDWGSSWGGEVGHETGRSRLALPILMPRGHRHSNRHRPVRSRPRPVIRNNVPRLSAYRRR